MRQLQITPKGHLVNQALQHNFGIITSVSNLIKHDMIYIYHHMKIGDPVMLKRNTSNPFEPTAIDVYFKGFKIGTIAGKSNKIVSKLLDRGEKITATIKTMHKQKFMPLNGLDIELRGSI